MALGHGALEWTNWLVRGGFRGSMDRDVLTRAGGRGLIGEAPPVGGSGNSVLFRPLDRISGTPTSIYFH
jgi:hypothetical protein